MPDDDKTNDFFPKTAVGKFYAALYNVIDAPVTYVREKVVEPIQGGPKATYYHRKYNRVPGIDECEVGDPVCFYEANEQFRRDKKVDGEIMTILRQRKLECQYYYGPDAAAQCKKQIAEYKTAETNWFIKYGELGAAGNVLDAYMKQKHRLIWERRHGEVGSTGKVQEAA